MSLDCLLIVQKDLLFKSVSQVKHDFISIRLDSIREEVDFKLNVGFRKVLEGQSELPADNEDLDRLVREQELAMSVQKLDDMVVREDNVSITVQVSPFVHNEHRNEICDYYYFLCSSNDSLGYY